jgi:hypothetical protein
MSRKRKAAHQIIIILEIENVAFGAYVLNAKNHKSWSWATAVIKITSIRRATIQEYLNWIAILIRAKHEKEYIQA